MEVDAAVDAFVRAFLLLDRASAYLWKPQSPPLELIRVIAGELRCVGQRDRLSYYLYTARPSNVSAKRPRMSVMARCVMSMPIQLRFSFCAAAMVVPHPQNGSSTTSPSLLLSGDDALQKSFGLLGRVAESFLGLRVDRRDVRPHVLQGNTRHFVEISFVFWHA